MRVFAVKRDYSLIHKSSLQVYWQNKIRFNGLLARKIFFLIKILASILGDKPKEFFLSEDFKIILEEIITKL